MSYPSRKYDPMASEGKVELDFPVLKFWWKNGNPDAIPAELDEATKKDLRKKLGVTYYGGWCVHRNVMDEAMQAMGKDGFPGVVLVKMSGGEGPYEAYCMRQITVAPIIKRMGWFTSKNRPDVAAKSRHEVLCYAAVPNAQTKSYEPWGLVVISAGSTSGLGIVNTLASWGRRIVKNISDPNHPAWAHWATIGTLRSDIYTELRGKGANVSPVTPCELYLPQTDEKFSDFVNRRYIGDELLAKCEEIREMSIAWAEDWNERKEAMSSGSDDETPDAPDNFPPDRNVPQTTEAPPDIPF